eukprot:1798955-Amphidinium_carterae.2
MTVPQSGVSVRLHLPVCKVDITKMGLLSGLFQCRCDAQDRRKTLKSTSHICEADFICRKQFTQVESRVALQCTHFSSPRVHSPDPSRDQSSAAA